MFFVIPVENKPSWKSPPWITILLILCNLLIFFGWQQAEEHAVYEAAKNYEQTQLPAIELPLFVAHLEGRAKDDMRVREVATKAHKVLNEKDYKSLYLLMWQEQNFRQKLLAGKVIKDDDPQYEIWQSERNTFQYYVPEEFTFKWSQNYNLESFTEIFQRPITLLTSIFLHGGFGHLLGNMIFLFIFGFTLEKVLKPALYLVLYLFAGISSSVFAAWAYVGLGNYGLGASGAISGLMAMYVMLYRFRRIKFFYFILFYFGYATLPALIMLPVWGGYEILQSFISDSNVSYMGHLGGILSGAFSMGILSLLLPLKIPAYDEEHKKTKKPQQTDLDKAILRAKKHSDKLEFDMASNAWRHAAKISPSDMYVLQSWFEIAQYSPAGKDFHTSARMIFQLHGQDEKTRELQKHTYEIYIKKAKPHARFLPEHILKLGRLFIDLDDLYEAERLCNMLENIASNKSSYADLVGALAAAWARSNQPNKAKAWLKTLQRLRPNDPIVSWLQKM